MKNMDEPGKATPTTVTRRVAGSGRTTIKGTTKPVPQRCGYCQEIGHNQRTCERRKQNRQAIAAEFEQRIQERDKEITQLRHDLTLQLSEFERERLEWKIKRLEEEKRGDDNTANEFKESKLPWYIRHSPAVIGLGILSITFAMEHFNYIPYPEVIGRVLLVSAAAVVSYWGAMRLRRMFARMS